MKSSRGFRKQIRATLLRSCFRVDVMIAGTFDYCGSRGERGVRNEEPGFSAIYTASGIPVRAGVGRSGFSVLGIHGEPSTGSPDSARVRSSSQSVHRNALCKFILGHKFII